MSPRIAAVIPFYQRSEGLLLRAVRSALGQAGVDGLEIIVVDDGSPVPARRELEGLMATARHAIRIVERPNGGPGAARNVGLDQVPAGVEYVAFLDSDDEWLPTHLASAIEALDRGYDFYFSDVRNAEAPDGMMRSKERYRQMLSRYQAVGDTYRAPNTADNMFGLALRRGLIVTSSVVYRFAKFPDLRFSEEFFNGEDKLFFLDILHATNRVIICTDAEVSYGEGVNTYQQAKWATDKTLRILHNRIRIRRTLHGRFNLSGADRAANDSETAKLRTDFVRCVLAMLRRRALPSLDLLAAHIRKDPGTILHLPRVLIRAIARGPERAS